MWHLAFRAAKNSCGFIPPFCYARLVRISCAPSGRAKLPLSRCTKFSGNHQ